MRYVINLKCCVLFLEHIPINEFAKKLKPVSEHVCIFVFNFVFKFVRAQLRWYQKIKYMFFPRQESIVYIETTPTTYISNFATPTPYITKFSTLTTVL